MKSPRCFWVLIVTVVLGCSTTSTIHTLNGPTIEAEIVSSDARTLRVSGSDVHEVQRDEVTAIDYPGNVHMTVGGSLLGVAILQIAVGVVMIAQNEPTEVITSQFGNAAVFGGVGAGLFFWGAKTYRQAQRATEPTGHRSPVPKTDGGLVVNPRIELLRGQKMPGIGVTFRF